MYDFYRLGLRRGIDGFISFSGAVDTYNSARKHIMQNKPYDTDIQKVFEGFLLVSFLFKFLKIIHSTQCIVGVGEYY